jgi:hypothetical protein
MNAEQWRRLSGSSETSSETSDFAKTTPQSSRVQSRAEKIRLKIEAAASAGESEVRFCGAPAHCCTPTTLSWRR